MATREELDITWGERIKQFENFYSTHHSVIFGRNEFYDIISTKEFPTGNMGQIQYDHKEDKWVAVAQVKEDEVYYPKWPFEDATGPTWRDTIEEAYNDLYEFLTPDELKTGES